MANILLIEIHSLLNKLLINNIFTKKEIIYDATQYLLQVYLFLDCFIFILLKTVLYFYSLVINQLSLRRAYISNSIGFLSYHLFRPIITLTRSSKKHPVSTSILCELRLVCQHRFVHFSLFLLESSVRWEVSGRSDGVLWGAAFRNCSE